MHNLTTQILASGIALPLASVFETLALSRATHYRHQTNPTAEDPDMQLRDRIQLLALEWPQYGYRRITAELHRLGVEANHKRVLRLMREDNLLCLRKRRFISTTDSNHVFSVYPNLVPELTLSSINQLWVADITYIRLLREFVYLAVVLDAYSRRCIGWALEPYLEAELAVEALRMALATRQVDSGLVHHSDRGVQYASAAYTDLLKERGLRISMSRRGNPYDNAQAERFMRTLKYEEVYLFEYETLAEARARVSHFLEEVYNQKRLHSAIGYVPPAEYEQQLCHSTDA
ncbi:MAG TPA: IS3 family transposase [Nitrososphaera sp.]|nr:IS3 family transposase [Nitrososphaera sp.]